MDPPRTYKIVVAGASGVGKTCLIRRLRTGDFVRDHVPTMGCEVHPLAFHTSHGLIVFKVWDLAGAQKFAGLGEGYYHGADGLIAVHDLTEPATYEEALLLLEKCPARARVLCGNKVDLQAGDLIRATEAPAAPVPRYMISARSNYNYEKPFLSLARQLTGAPALAFVEAPAVMPPCVSTEPAHSASPTGFLAEDRLFSSLIMAHESYDTFGEPLNVRLQDLQEEAGCAGYDMVIDVKVSFRKADTL